ncbi:DUF4856 domain-containing protein [Neotamlana laminarinivorans]|uniref:DUF4856 domain-containing protein n=1 Tax=Neotamlana laminarinivorans TaxID=2883124 RepID=A0A9X1L4X8_9FLAO|nr:DUF4856 domain-containing protein [Tamlana laminarinivorans]MCB4799949.1 DUF4856 domain-containing protein [Tamlana laminarinivorans]
MKKIVLSALVMGSFFVSCSSDDNGGDSGVVAPASYSFTRDGEPTVDFNGQTTRILMGEEFLSALTETSNSEAVLDAMFAHAEGESDFSDADLNASDKSIRSKTAASTDYFSANTTDASAIKAEFDSWIAAQVDEVFPNWDTDAVSGTAGKIQEAGGGSTRYVNAKGLEYNQAINKGLIGALMVDQALNNYLSPAVLDAGSNVADNDADVVADGKSYTNMEHKWDEAYGYVYGLNADATNPNADLGADSFLNKYIGRVEDDDDFAGIADEIYEAFKLGRAAIVAKNYDVRDAQAEVIKEKLSEVIGVRAVYYLLQGKLNLGVDYASAFHDLSEGFGFVYSLQFTRQPNSDEPYFTKAEVDAFIATLTDGNGFWDISTDDLDAMATEIASRFNFTTEQAGS